eukprot:scaffold7340_cov266-Pinguiococcus_pyrenoidosus.AAC.24
MIRLSTSICAWPELRMPLMRPTGCTRKSNPPSRTNLGRMRSRQLLRNDAPVLPSAAYLLVPAAGRFALARRYVERHVVVEHTSDKENERATWLAGAKKPAAACVIVMQPCSIHHRLARPSIIIMHASASQPRAKAACDVR